ncbi:MAG: 2-oxoglutarate dehydrogenase, E2 component, dihydrolipoamide succinyltransferase [Microbacterium sp.]|uniref:2-oxoglutarate dehydrogenase, E2 component, dihydrolipoamide succinyltransferase n=1 Tax=unclassified Microbacterium TaxID=2609290 RepID=UPI000C49AEB4|nr:MULTISPECIES: 2-oxoglutarate dehydrogenase, E2 component, dihydrolipoamide succinyltransferase [unclassified Microbacterium]MAY50949.1 2-oxoglutarate dehydrogenase, E2 component, dihydrolipoamide succinyltransferase [Microbacterium sp.]HAS32729.1 2-oxoglutarate dehydrogenase, E2 component, dihydrolipoamide succinyltransferase [Microbacterium sp.]|tara:strand:+ start:60377 stop:62080 length:1704 start_codon:yes stop_codon:yes gene_type:complete
MSTSVVLPALGESVTEGTVTRWLKQVGDTIQEDEGLLEISTDKVDTEIPSPVSGVIEEILVQEDETVEVGAVLAKIGDGDGAPSEDTSDDSAQAEAPAQPEAKPAEEPAAEDSGPEQAAHDTSTASDADGKDVVLPELGESVTEGTVTRWLKSIGDDVEVDEPLLEISTDKVDTEIPSPFAGTLQQILVQEDETVAVGSPLAKIGSGSPAPAEAPSEESAPEEPASAEETSAPEPAEEPAPAPAAEEQTSEPEPAPAPEKAAAAPSASDDIYVTPLVRRLAQQQGVDLASVTGTGVGGRIRKEDVLKAAEAPATPTSAAEAAPVEVEVSPLRGTTQPMSRLRKVLAERAVASMQSTAQLTTVVEVDVTKLSQYRDRVKKDFQAKTGDKLSFLPFFALAAAEALQTYPIINSTVDGDKIVYPATENVSIAVDTERGLLTPVLRDAASKNLAQIAHEIADLAARTRDNKLKPDELAGGTFTLTNTGSRGALFDTPVVFLPQSAILGTGTVVKRPGVVTVDGAEAISVRSYVYLALSYDHRTIDGADAARFLAAVKKRLEDASFEANLGA